MNPKNVLSLRLRTPRALALAGLMALVIVVTALALTQTSTVAAPPPPLRGPFRFVELPKEMSAAEASTAILPWTPFYTQTFGAGFYSDSHWWITNTTTLYNPPAPYMWGTVQQNEYTTQPFTDTLWVMADAKQGIVYERYKLPSGAIYTETMDTWAIYGPLDAQQYGRFQAEFDFYLDAGPGASFGWAVSADGTNFYGPASLSGHTGWTHSKVVLPSGPGQTDRPVYLAFFFQSDDSAPAGLGAFVDNLVISGQVWNKIYMPSVRRDLTPTPAASPTPTAEPYPVTQSYDFGSLGKWCSTSNDNWASGIVSLGGSNAYYLAMKQSSYLWALSPRDSSADNFRITANFSLLRMNNSLSLSNYRGADFGLLFTVKGNPFDPNDNCIYNGGQAGSGIGFYRFIIKIKDDGSGYQTRLTRWENGVEPEQNGNFVDLPAGVTINRTGWNTMRIDRVGGNMKAYINDVLVQNWDNANSGTGGWFGLFTETNGNNASPNFESDWDNIKVYNLKP